MPRSDVTIRDVAAHAGVSHQTVSRVINDSERVLPETRAKVEAAIMELGYRPNAIARSMARGTTSILACISPNLTDYTFASLINGAEIEARKHGYFLLSASAPDKETFAALIGELVTSRRSEGVMVINPYVDGRYTHLPQDFPIVFAGARPRENTTHSVSLNDVEVARLATKHLIDQGHRTIGMVTGIMDEDCSQDRNQGYQQALEDAGIPFNPELIIEGNWQPASGHDALMQFSANENLPSAIFAQNDQMAAGVLRAARALGLNLPDQLSVIGIDNIPMSAYFEPPLTTYEQDFANIGKNAARLLIQAVERPLTPYQHLQLPARFVHRQSTTTYQQA